MSLISKVAGGRLYLFDTNDPRDIRSVMQRAFNEDARRLPSDRKDAPVYVQPSGSRPGLPPRQARPLDFALGPRPGSLPEASSSQPVANVPPPETIFLNPQRFSTMD